MNTYNKIFYLLRNIHTTSIHYLERNIPKTTHEFEKFDLKPSEQPDNARLLRVSIIGCPNAGKSTLLNQLIDWKVSAVSSKVHTTRKNVIGVYVDDNIQIEFCDTPGLTNNKQRIRYKLETSFINDLKYSIDNCDIITILSDVSNKRDKCQLNSGILNLLQENPKKESILVLNKIDRIKEKRKLLDIIYTLTNGIVGGQRINMTDDESMSLKMELKYGKFDRLFKRTEQYYLNYNDKDSPIQYKIGWPHFSRVFMISALHNDGITELRNYFKEKAVPNLWKYDAKVVTKQNPKQIIINSIKEVCLDLLKQEVPYNISCQIVMWETDNIGNLYLVVDIFTKQRFLSWLIGPKGSVISKIANKSRQVLSNIFRCDVSLKLAVKSFS